jgi:hypothetical protein
MTVEITLTPGGRQSIRVGDVSKKRIETKRALSGAAIVASVFFPGLANAAPTCHQKVVVSQMDNIPTIVSVSNKIAKAIRDQVLDFISSSKDDRSDKAFALVTAITVAVADATKTQINDDVKDLAVQVANDLISKFNDNDKVFKDTMMNNNVKNGQINTARDVIINGFLACK